MSGKAGLAQPDPAARIVAVMKAEEIALACIRAKADEQADLSERLWEELTTEIRKLAKADLLARQEEELLQKVEEYVELERSQQKLAQRNRAALLYILLHYFCNIPLGEAAYLAQLATNFPIP